MKCKLFLVLILTFIISSTAFSNTVQILARLNHLGEENAITIAYHYDNERGVICLSATISESLRNHRVAKATATKCYRGDSRPVFIAENNGQHNLRGERSDQVTMFKVSDRANNMTCYGSSATESDYGSVRLGAGDTFAPRVFRGSVLMTSASISMDCL